MRTWLHEVRETYRLRQAWRARQVKLTAGNLWWALPRILGLAVLMGIVGVGIFAWLYLIFSGSVNLGGLILAFAMMSFTTVLQLVAGVLSWTP